MLAELPSLHLMLANQRAAVTCAPADLSGDSTRIAPGIRLLSYVVAQAAAPYRDGLYVGAAADAYYGGVQVQANIQSGQLVSVKVLRFPNDRNTSRYINSQAIPVLQQEAVAAQTSHVDTVSGATLTSEAFMQSLSDALGQAAGSQSPAANAA